MNIIQKRCFIIALLHIILCLPVVYYLHNAKLFNIYLLIHMNIRTLIIFVIITLNKFTGRKIAYWDACLVIIPLNYFICYYVDPIQTIWLNVIHWFLMYNSIPLVRYLYPEEA